APEWTLSESLPPVACLTPAANRSMFAVWKLAGAYAVGMSQLCAWDAVAASANSAPAATVASILRLGINTLSLLGGGWAEAASLPGFRQREKLASRGAQHRAAEAVVGIDQFVEQLDKRRSLAVRQGMQQTLLRGLHSGMVPGDELGAFLGGQADLAALVVRVHDAQQQLARLEPLQHVVHIGAIDTELLGDRELIEAGHIDQDAQKAVLHRRHLFRGEFLHEHRNMDLVQPPDEKSGPLP